MPHQSTQKVIGYPFIELLTVDSTNNYARQLIEASSLPERQEVIPFGTAVFAHEQVAGKGQRGKIWQSEKGANIALSIILKPHSAFPSAATQFQLTACIAVAMHEFLIKYTGDDAKIKWPNDLYWQDRKAGGILIESGITNGMFEKEGIAPPKWKWAIAGIGLNINQKEFPGFLFNPVSLKQITGKHFNTVSMAKEICEILNEKITLLSANGFDSIYQLYLEQLYKKNELVKFKKDNRVFEAIVNKVSPEGKLVLQHSIEEEFGFGEIEWVIN